MITIRTALALDLDSNPLVKMICRARRK